MIITVYASMSKEEMFQAGIKAGLPSAAAKYFMYMSEVKLKLSVDPENGAVTDVWIDENWRSLFK
jgi:hypothetical protein